MTENSSKLQEPIHRINQFKSFYENLISLTDVEDLYGENSNFINNSISHKTDNSINLMNLDKTPALYKVILFIYLLGAMFFFIRFVYLLICLKMFSKRYPAEKIDGYKVFVTNDKTTYFSFFNYIFINKNRLSPLDFNKVFAHEKIHAKQKHSLDLLFAQILSIVHWFNPMAWRIHKSMKIVHEYIADRKVVEQGFELFDYQSLLLSQLVSIRSVELVNNFNLLSIKKRIAMMNKIKSGRIARLKALIIVPIIIAVFFVFTDMKITEHIDNKNYTNPVFFNQQTYPSISRPVSKYYKIISPEEITFQVVYDGSLLTLNSEECKLEKFSDFLKQKVEAFETAPKHMKVNLDIGANVKMESISLILNGLRQNNVLKTAYLVDPISNEDNQNKTYALLQYLPPADAKDLEKDEVRKKGFEIFEFDSRMPIKKVTKELERILQGDQEYILEYSFSENTSYQTFINYSSAVHLIYQKVRNEYAQENYKKDLNELDDKTKKEVRFKYPIRLVLNY
jgi:biopolymer transport protein ExbD